MTNSIREHLLTKRMFSFGHCPNEGGGALVQIKIRGNSKHSFCQEVFPNNKTKINVNLLCFWSQTPWFLFPNLYGQGWERDTVYKCYKCDILINSLCPWTEVIHQWRLFFEICKHLVWFLVLTFTFSISSAKEEVWFFDGKSLLSIKNGSQ